MSDLSLYREAAYLPEGPDPGADLQMIRPGVVVARDTVANRLLVSYNDGVGVWLSALPGTYPVGQTCWVLCNPLRGGRAELVLSQINGASNTTARAAVLVSIDANLEVAVVTLDGVEYTIPFAPSSYIIGDDVWVLCNPTRWGAPELMLAPCSYAPVDPAPEPIPTPTPGTGTVQVTTTISPQWSGSWRTIRGGWDRWNTGRYGGRSDLYQGDAFGSGQMIGLATYGDQLANLGAISIDAVTVSLIGNGGDAMPGPAVIQGSPDGGQPGSPTTAGETVTSGLGTPGLPASIREGMRTGAVKGLALVGGGYIAVRGTSHPLGMALSVTYTRSV